MARRAAAGGSGLSAPDDVRPAPSVRAGGTPAFQPRFSAALFEDACMMRAKRLFRMTCAALVAIALPAEQACAQGQDRGPAVLRDAETEQFLQDISAGMAQSAGLTPGALHLYVINDPEINAFVAPLCDQRSRDQRLRRARPDHLYQFGHDRARR